MPVLGLAKGRRPAWSVTLDFSNPPPSVGQTVGWAGALIDLPTRTGAPSTSRFRTVQARPKDLSSLCGTLSAQATRQAREGRVMDERTTDRTRVRSLPVSY